MTPVRVAAVGVGGWGRVLADATRQGTGLAIVACTSRSADNRAAFAKAYGCRIHPSFEAVLADPHVIDDATSILFEFASGSLGYLGTSWVHANRTAVITVHTGPRRRRGARRMAPGSFSRVAARPSESRCP